MKNYRNYEIWQIAIELSTDIYKITEILPNSEKFGLISQIRRCSVSIPSNIAEGTSRETDKDFKRFLTISLGSIFELETQLLICHNLNYIDSEKLNKTQADIDILRKKIISLIKKLRN